MLIGIDCRAMQGRGGIAHYTYNLVKHLLFQDKKNHYVLFFDAHISQSRKKILEQKNCSIRNLPPKILPLVYSHFTVSNFFNKQRLDLVHFPTGSAPLGYQGKFVITIHDLAIYKHPEWFPSYQWFSKKMVVPSSLKRAQKIIAVSQVTKKDIIKIFGVSEKKIKVIYEAGITPLSLRNGRSFHPKIYCVNFGGPDLIYQTQIQGAINRAPTDSEYILCISTLEPRKNLGRLIHAFALYRKKYPKSKEKLVIIGGEGWKFKSIYDTVFRFKLQDEVIFTGFISEGAKIKLIKRAKVFIFPSLYEGFGLPILEAMSLETPVICSKKGALGEIAQNAAYFVNPYDIQSIFRALVKVLRNNNLRNMLIRRGRERASHFSWQKCAQETLEVYKKMNE